MQNLPLLKGWSKRYIGLLDAEDVMQECYIALCKAVNTFEADKGYKFVTYLTSVVKTHFIKPAENAKGVRLGDNDKKLLTDYNKLNKQWQQATGLNIDEASALRHLNCSKKQLDNIKRYIKLNKQTSIDEPVGDDMNVLDVLPDKINIEQDYEDQDTRKYLTKIWDYVNDICNNREAETLKQIYVDGRTETEVSKSYELSLSRVGQIKSQAFRRLRNDKDFVQWAQQFDDICAIAYNYRFSTWKNKGLSAVELAFEMADREERRRQWHKKLDVDYDEIKRMLAEAGSL